MENRATLWLEPGWLTEADLYEPLVEAGYVEEEERLRAVLLARRRGPSLRDWGDDQY